jgi:hypothetical protein
MTAGGRHQLRIGATLSHAIPGIGLCIRRGSVPLLCVGGPERTARAAPWVSICSFRRSVSQCLANPGHADLLTSLIGLDFDDLVIDIATDHRSRFHPGGIISSLSERRMIRAFATTLNVVQVRRIVSERQTAATRTSALTRTAMSNSWRIGLSADSEVDATLVWVENRIADEVDASCVFEALHCVLARCAIEEADQGPCSPDDPARLECVDDLGFQISRLR